MQKLHNEFKSQGLEIVAINNIDAPSVVNKYISDEKWSFPIALGKGQGRLFAGFGVQAYPTNYLIDSNGQVIYRSIAFDETTLRASLAKMGFK